MDRVLVVEDDPDINAVLREALSLAGYEAVGALTGEAALGEIQRRRPGLVLLDQMLPDVDGLELCRRLRADPQTRLLPIIFVTARAAEEARIRGLACGADDYVVKPFSMEELLLRVRALLRRSAPLPDTRIGPAWLHCREQFRVWDTYARIHLEREEWQECLELCRSILGRCEQALSPAERRLLFLRLAACAQKLGDASAERAWRLRAGAESSLV
ncbi:MAG TPA: response regulator [Polyangia bacterium]|jgi:DNA-binding response OmpR family regulator|nr:response regulator [Polyangia bacterium]